MEPSAVWPLVVSDDSPEDDMVLVAAAQADATAFAVLYARYLPRVYRYLRVRSPGDEEAADLTQQVFLQAWQALPGYQARGVPFAAWLFRIARHLATDAYRRRGPTLAWDAVPVEAQPPADIDLEAALLRQEALARLRDLLARLPADKRELLALRFAARLTAREIGAVVGKSEAAVHKQIERTLHTLKDQYDEP